MPQHDDKHHKNKKIVVIEKVRDKYGSVIALKVVLYRRHDTENGKVWDMKRSHTFSAAFSRRACREQAKTLARQWADKYGAKVVKRGVVVLFESLCYTGGVHIKTIPKKENTMRNINLYGLMSKLSARPEVRTADIVSWEGTIKTVMRNGTVVAIGVQDEYPAVALYTTYASDEDYRNKEPLTEGLYYDFEDDHDYKNGVDNIIKEAC